MSPLLGAVRIANKHGEQIRIQSGPMRRHPGGSPPGARYRATLAGNGWGPACWHQTPEAAIDCLHERIAQGYAR